MSNLSFKTDVEVEVDLMFKAQRDEKYCDLTIVCGEYRCKVHRNVVCIRPNFFEKACEGGFNLGNL